MGEKRKFIDLFSGAGGLSEGLSDAGFELIWAVDNNEHTKDTFDENHSAEMEVADIREISPPDLGLEKGELDLVVGGPPCPTFSMVGRTKINSLEGRSNTSDERHQLYEHFLRFVDHYNPKAFVMENVKGMESAENEEGEPVVEVIRTQMEDLGYSVKVQVLDAADFGVPQHRERIFFIGNRIGQENPNMDDWKSHRQPAGEEEKKIKFAEVFDSSNPQSVTDFAGNQNPFPSFKKNQEKRPWNTVADAILDLPPLSPAGDTPPQKMEKYSIPAISEYQKWVRDLPESQSWEEAALHNHECRGHNMRDLTLYKFLGEGVSWIIGDLPEEAQPYRTDIFPDKYKKQNPKEPSSTIVAHLYKDGNMFIHPREARSITPREAARLQSFRDSFIFPVSRTQAYKQIGNAVPPLLAQAVGTAVRTDIFDEENLIEGE